jgi:hypothetical protein
VAIVGAALTLAGCGGEGLAAELIRIDTQDTLDFRMDSSDGQEHVFAVEATWIVDRDGTATETVTEPAPGGSTTVKLSASELTRVKHALADLDVASLEDRFGTERDGDGTTSITYRGRTTTLDSRVMGFSPAHEAPPAARPFARLVSLLASLTETPQGDATRDRGPSVGAEPSR